MQDEKFFVINNSDDGIYIDQMNKEQLLKAISKDEDGYSAYGDKELEFLDHIPNCIDGYLEKKEGQLIIIKGDFVIPKLKTIITTYEI